MVNGIAKLHYFPVNQPTIVADIHGTLSDFTHRLKFIKHFQPDWDQWNRELTADLPVKNIISLLHLAQKARWCIILVTGTPEKYHSILSAWLRRHGVPFDALFMRKDGDYRSDVDVKLDMYHEHFAAHDINLVLEDRDKVVELWRSLGLACMQVRKGEY